MFGTSQNLFKFQEKQIKVNFIGKIQKITGKTIDIDGSYVIVRNVIKNKFNLWR